jgi:hypothetical protein
MGRIYKTSQVSTGLLLYRKVAGCELFTSRIGLEQQQFWLGNVVLERRQREPRSPRPLHDDRHSIRAVMMVWMVERPVARHPPRTASARPGVNHHPRPKWPFAEVDRPRTRQCQTCPSY